MRRPLFTILSVLAIIAVFAISALNLKFGSREYSDSFPPWDKVYMTYERYYRDFGLSPEDVYVLIKAESLSDDVIEYAANLERNLRHVEGVVSTLSWVADRDLILITVQIAAAGSEMEIAKEIERTIQFVPAPPGVTVDVTGGAVLMYQITQAVKEDVYRTFLLASMIMVAILIAVFSSVVRRKRTILFPLLISLLSVVIMVGSMPILGIKMTEYVSSTVPILIGLSIDYAVQIQNRFEEERREGRKTLQAMLAAVKTTRMPLFMAMATTVIGFASMAAPMIPSLFWFALLMSIGLVSAFLLSLILLPAMLVLTDKAGSEGILGEGIVEAALSSIAEFTISHHRKILIVTVILILIGAYAAANVQLETNRRKYAPPDLPALLKFEELERRVSPQYVYVIVLSADINPDTIRKVEELANYIASRENFVHSYKTIGRLFIDFFGYLPHDDLTLSKGLLLVPDAGRLVSGNQLVILLYTNTQTEEEVKAAVRNIKADIEFLGGTESTTSRAFR